MRSQLIAALLGAMLVSGVASATETVFVVDSEIDAIDAIPGDGVCATLDGECTLRAAVIEANALQEVDSEATFRIELPAGTFILAIPGPDEDASLTGDLDLCFEGEVRGAGRDETTIVGDGSDRVIHVGSCGPSRPLLIAALGVKGGNVIGDGGGIGSTILALTLRDCRLEGNISTGFGGGVSARAGIHVLTIDRCVIRQNVASLGGGVGMSGSGLVEVSGSLLSGNHADVGGGIRADEARLLILSSTIMLNSAMTGGGVSCLLCFPHIANSTAASNSAAIGGGFYFPQAYELEFNNATIVRNSAEVGGGIYFSGSGEQVGDRRDYFWVGNSILAGNEGTQGVECSVSQGSSSRPLSLRSRGFNLVGSASGCAFAQVGSDLVGTDGQPVDPLLSQEYLAGRISSTLAPLPGSPAIDAGSPEEAGSTESACGTKDARGVVRPQDGDGDGVARCDIGAHELVAATDVMPRQYDFGFVNLGDAALQLVTISNAGDAPLLLDGIALDAAPDSGYELASAPPLPSRLEPGESVDLGVSFGPSEPGSIGAILRIESSDPEEPEIEVLLTGFGVTYHEQAMALLAFFDGAVASGGLVGGGPGNSAGARLMALRNMIGASGDLLEQGRTIEACRQLEDARRRTDGLFPPPDFVGGSAAPELEAEITQLRANLRCDAPPVPAPGGRSCGLGVELGLLLPLLQALRARRWRRLAYCG